MTRTVSDVIVEALVDQGVRQVFGVVGDALNSFTDAIRRTDDIDWIGVRHEEVGAFAASAQAQLKGSLAVCAGGGASLARRAGSEDAWPSYLTACASASRAARDETIASHDPRIPEATARADLCNDAICSCTRKSNWTLLSRDRSRSSR